MGGVVEICIRWQLNLPSIPTFTQTHILHTPHLLFFFFFSALSFLCFPLHKQTSCSPSLSLSLPFLSLLRRKDRQNREEVKKWTEETCNSPNHSLSLPTLSSPNLPRNFTHSEISSFQFSIFFFWFAFPFLRNSLLSVSLSLSLSPNTPTLNSLSSSTIRCCVAKIFNFSRPQNAIRVIRFVFRGSASEN